MKLEIVFFLTPVSEKGIVGVVRGELEFLSTLSAFLGNIYFYGFHR